MNTNPCLSPFPRVARSVAAPVCFSVCIGILFAIAVPVLAQDPATDPPNGALCHPPSWDAIVPSITTDAHLKRLYGPGVYSPEGGHVGTRFYLAKNGQYTVEVELGVDYIVETVTVTSGVALPGGVSRARATSKALPQDPLRRRLRFGATSEEVRRILGPPSSKPSDSVWVYTTDYRPTECIAAAEITVQFSHGLLHAVSFHSGD